LFVVSCTLWVVRPAIVVALLGPLVVAAGTAQTDSPSAERLLTRLAIDLAPEGDVLPIEVVVNKITQLAVYDRFRLVGLAARAAFRAGTPLDPDNPPADLLKPRLVILGFARSPRGEENTPAREVRLSDRSGRNVTRIGVLKGADLAAVLPGVEVPPLTLAVAFGIPNLRPSDRIAIVFNDRPGFGQPIGGMPIGAMSSGPTPGTMTVSVVVTPPKAKVETAPEPPPGVTIAAGRNVVKVEGVLDLVGRVRYARALDGPPELHAAATSAVGTWQYEPARMWATPIPLVMQASVTFPVRQ
jgi:hypothetical protein